MQKSSSTLCASWGAVTNTNAPRNQAGALSGQSGDCHETERRLLPEAAAPSWLPECRPRAARLSVCLSATSQEIEKNQTFMWKLLSFKQQLIQHHIYRPCKPKKISLKPSSWNFWLKHWAPIIIGVWGAYCTQFQEGVVCKNSNPVDNWVSNFLPNFKICKWIYFVLISGTFIAAVTKEPLCQLINELLKLKKTPKEELLPQEWFKSYSNYSLKKYLISDCYMQNNTGRVKRTETVSIFKKITV